MLTLITKTGTKHAATATVPLHGTLAAEAATRRFLDSQPDAFTPTAGADIGASFDAYPTGCQGCGRAFHTGPRCQAVS